MPSGFNDSTAFTKSGPNDSGQARNDRWLSQNFRHSANVSRLTRMVLVSMSLAHEVLGCWGMLRTLFNAVRCPLICSRTASICAVSSPWTRNTNGNNRNGTTIANSQK